MQNRIFPPNKRPSPSITPQVYIPSPPPRSRQRYIIVVTFLAFVVIVGWFSWSGYSVEENTAVTSSNYYGQNTNNKLRYSVDKDDTLAYSFSNRVPLAVSPCPVLPSSTGTPTPPSPTETPTTTPLSAPSSCPVCPSLVPLLPTVVTVSQPNTKTVWPPSDQYPPRPGASAYPNSQVGSYPNKEEYTGAYVQRAEAALHQYLQSSERTEKMKDLDLFCPKSLVESSPNATAVTILAPSKFAWNWQADLADKIAELECRWTTQGFDFMGGRTMHTCVGDEEEAMSKYIIASGSYFNIDTVKELAALRICPPESPFVIDVGLNLGSFSFMALQLGCHVIAFEPLLRNIGRVARGLAANPDLGGRFWLLKNAVCARRIDAVQLVFAPGNSGGSHVKRKGENVDADPATGTVEEAPCVVIDDLFFPPSASVTDTNENPSVPRGSLHPAIVHPLTGLPLTPKDIGFIKVDAEGFDLQALHGMQKLLKSSNASFMLEMHPPGDACDSYAWLDWVDELHFAYLHTEGLGAKGSRWLDKDRFKRLVYMSTHGSEYAPEAGRGFAPVFEGLFLRGRMREAAEKLWPR